MRSLKVATRKSPLALWQARHVVELIQSLAPGTEISLVEMTTQGNRFLQAPLSRVGGKGLFVKEIEQALVEGRADLAVHSLKDMTSRLADGLVLAAVPEREDPRDAFVSSRYASLAQAPKGSSIGTSSLRRGCQLMERRPDLKVEQLRGNVQTRLKRVEERGMAGAVLALAGLKRLELEKEVAEILDPGVSLPAVGQGALAIECRADDVELLNLLRCLEHPDTRVAVNAERAMLARMEGGCTVPVAGYAAIAAGRLQLKGLVGRPDGTRVIRGERVGSLAQAEQMGVDLAEELLANGGKAILEQFGSAPPVEPP